MKYRLLGRTGLLVSELCLGTMTFGSGGRWKAIAGLDQSTANRIVKGAVDAGINFIDTANVYSEGESEIQLGNAIHELGLRRNNLIVATKVRGRVGPGPNEIGLTRGQIMNSVDESLSRLRTDYIDLYQIHGVDPITPIDETLRALDDLVRVGKVRYIGCSNLMAWQIAKALGLSAAHDWARFETVQAYYSIASRDLEREIFPLTESEKLGVMVWSPLAGGLLSGKYRRDQPGPADSRRAAGFNFPPVDLDHAYRVIEAMDPIAARHEVSVARIALAWVLHQKAVTTVIIGAKSETQLADNLAAADFVLPQEDIDALETATALKPEYPRWMIDFQSTERLKDL